MWNLIIPAIAGLGGLLFGNKSGSQTSSKELGQMTAAEGLFRPLP